jgi:hypothetical protein
LERWDEGLGEWKMLLTILSKIKRSPRLAWARKYINMLYYDPYYVQIDLRSVSVVEVDGYKFCASDQVSTLMKVEGNPWFSGVRPDDIVVDLGANIGAITIPLAFKTKKVWAIEPLYQDRLLENITLNKLANVKILPIGIGNGEANISFAGRSARFQLVPFKDLKKMIGHIDFLKCDIEGSEWTIEPEEFLGIRELRLELHMRRGNRGDKDKLKHWLTWLRVHYPYVEVGTQYYGVNPTYSQMNDIMASQNKVSLQDTIRSWYC